MFANSADPDEPTRNVDLNHIAFLLNCVAVAFGMVSVGTTVCGIVTVVYAAPHFKWPFTPCSGIWTGVVGLLASVVGVTAFMRFDSGQPRATKCLVTTFYALVIANISCAGQHVVYSVLGLANCATHADNCNLDQRDGLILTQSFSVVFAAIALVLAIVTTIYISTRGRLPQLTGMPPSMVHGTCCAGECDYYSC